jgi:hypothetical protein
MSSSTVFARGSEWSADVLYDTDSWGDGITREQAHALGDLVITRFEELAAAAGDPSIWWSPRTSEVVGECYGESRDGHHWSDPLSGVNLDLDELRGQAGDEVWDAVCGDASPMGARVREVLNIEMTVTDAAGMYQVPRSSITWAIRNGYLVGEKRRGQWYVWSNDIEDWKAARPGSGRR